jgi:hypothetical protein
MAKLSVAIAASALTFALSAGTLAAETNTTGPDAVTQAPAPAANQSDKAGVNGDQSAQMPKSPPGRVEEEKEQGAKNGQLSGPEQTPALKRDNDAGSAEPTGPASTPAR